MVVYSECLTCDTWDTCRRRTETSFLFICPALPKRSWFWTQNIEFALHTRFEHFERITEESTVGRSWRFLAFFGKGIFASAGHSWRQQRSAARPYFTTKALEDYVPIFDEQAKIVVDLLAKAQEQGSAIDVQDVFFRYTLDSFGLMGFGFDFGSLIDPPQFPALFDALQLRVEETLRNPIERNAKVSQDKLVSLVDLTLAQRIRNSRPSWLSSTRLFAVLSRRERRRIFAKRRICSRDSCASPTKMASRTMISGFGTCCSTF